VIADLTSLYEWISGKGEPRLVKLVPLARALGVSVDYLLGLEQTSQTRDFEPDNKSHLLTPGHFSHASAGAVEALDVDLLVEILSTLGRERFWSTTAVQERARIVSKVYAGLANKEQKPTRARILSLVQGGRRS
jgi:transcriptional regulator with XRE-family HTH domain